uniref:hypothetical protein n=1 Tax=Salmonella sp. s54925 TaxID=3159674 RepID=UPI00397EBA6F
VVVGVGEADKKQLAQLVATPDHLIMVEKFEEAKQKLVALSKEFCPPTDDNGCSVVRLAIDLRIGGCISQKPVDVGVCSGQCSSDSRFMRLGNVYEHPCSCCKPKTKVTKTVSLHCSMNTTQAFEILEAASCACNSC